MTKEEASIKMAELAKVKLSDSGGVLSTCGYLVEDDWNPEENLEQAFEVLDNITSVNHVQRVGNTYTCEILKDLFPHDRVCYDQGKTRAQSIFNAVRKWMEAEGER